MRVAATATAMALLAGAKMSVAQCSIVTPMQQAFARVMGALSRGEVVTYGEIAEEAGFPGRARAVGHFLARRGGDYAWWRVVRSDGRLVPGNEAEQRRLLRSEGVEVALTAVVGMRRRKPPR